jgi:hypothetical protein
MSKNMLVCPMCGHHYDPSAHIGCQSCVLNKSCQLVCCPACGFKTVDPGKSTLARLVGRWLGSERSEKAAPNNGLTHDRS